MSEQLLTVEEATERATRPLRLAHAYMARRWPSAELQEILEDTSPESLYEAFVERFPPDKAHTLVLAMQAHAGGYDPEQCEVVFLPDPENREIPWRPVLTCEDERRETSMSEDLFQSNMERRARGQVGRQAELDDPLSPYHGQTGTIVDTMTLEDKQIVFTVEWSDGERLPYVPACLKIDDQPD
jgi:hypothetical protein